MPTVPLRGLIRFQMALAPIATIVLVLLAGVPVAHAAIPPVPSIAVADDPAAIWLGTRAFDQAPAPIRDARAPLLQALAANTGAQDGSEAAPNYMYRDFIPACDLDGDGKTDLISHDFDFVGFPRPPRSTIRAISGDDGAVLWSHDNKVWTGFRAWNPAGVTFPEQYKAPERSGLPTPQWPLSSPPTVVIVDDQDGDGVCDVLAYGFEWQVLLQYAFPLIDFSGDLRLISGATNAVVWSHPISVRRIDVVEPFFTGEEPFYRMTNFPTGFHVFESPTGWKIAWKLTDMAYSNRPSRNWLVHENINLMDAATGEIYWNRSIVYPEPRSTWITGAADLTGDSEFEIILDSDLLELEFTIRALAGELDGGGADVWGPTRFNNPPRRGQLSLTEESGESLIWSHAYVIGDITGDGRPELVGSYLAQTSDAGSASSAFRSHFAPIDGALGTLLWPTQDIKLQGWGFASDLNPSPDESRPYLAIATADVPIPPPPGGRYLELEYRMSVLDVADGTPRWSTRDRLALDTPLAYNMALAQFLGNLAPTDANGDGVRDPMTPARPVTPKNQLQRLVSSSHHMYEVHDALGGEVVREHEFWGPSGLVLACDGASTGEVDHPLTVASGYAPWLAVSRKTGDRDFAWHHATTFNPTRQAQLGGTELVYMGARCGEGDDGRTMFGYSVGKFSLKRSFMLRPEVTTAFGFVKADGSLDLLEPRLLGEPPDAPSLKLLVIDAPEASTLETVTYSAGPALPGIGLGVAFGLWRRRHSTGVRP